MVEKHRDGPQTSVVLMPSLNALARIVVHCANPFTLFELDFLGYFRLQIGSDETCISSAVHGGFHASVDGHILPPVF